MYLVYAIPFIKADQTKGVAWSSHPSCFGSLPGASCNVPEGATPLPKLYLSTELSEKDFKFCYDALKASVPTVTVNGRVYKAPRVVYYNKGSSKFGSISSAGQVVRGGSVPFAQHIAIHFPKDIPCGDIYPIVKYYFKVLTLPYGSRTCPRAPELFREGLKLLTLHGYKAEASIVHAAMGISGNLIGYSFPLGSGNHDRKLAADVIFGKIKTTYNRNGQVYNERAYESVDRTAPWCQPKTHLTQIFIGDIRGSQSVTADPTDKNPLKILPFCGNAPSVNSLQTSLRLIMDTYPEHKV